MDANLLEYNTVSTFKHLIDAGASINESLISFCQTGYGLGGLRFLLESGADPNYMNKYGKKPLMLLYEYGTADQFSLLLAFGADPNVRNEYDYPILDICIAYGKDEMVKLLLDAGASMDMTGSNGNALCSWANRGGEKYYNKILKYLIDAGIDVNQGMRMGDTVIVYVLKSLKHCITTREISDSDDDREDMIDNCIEAIKILLEAGADPDIGD